MALAFCVVGAVSPAPAQLINLNDYTLNFVDAAEADAPGNTLGLSNPTGVDEWRMLIHLVVVFDNTGGPMVGATFTDYFAISVDRLVDDISQSVVTPGMGTLAAAAGVTPTHELTIVGKFTGRALSVAGGGSSGLSLLDIEPTAADYRVIFDAASDGTGAGYTLSTTTDWSSFDDGTVVEQINALSFGKIVQTSVTLPTMFDGAFDAKGPIVDVLSSLGSFDAFELDYLDENGDLIDETGLEISHTVDGNFTLDGVPSGIFGANGQGETEIDDFLGALFSVDYDPTTQSAFGFRSDASLNKDALTATVVPEPLTSGLIAVALGVLGAYVGRRPVAA
ncbi:MAG: hypothetical protein CMJ18_00030 [Phycisphaeraceae bacterium]|nr:hypothetical protein [Phycisphaeraceae bacterium]